MDTLSANARQNTDPDAVGIGSLLTVFQTAQRLNLSPTGVRRLAHRGVLPSIKLGRRILFNPRSIERLIANREVGGDIPARRGRRPSA
jgi:excisionase family DNA binding protein